jgi:hypothetical protein
VEIPEVASGMANIAASFETDVAAAYIILNYEGEIGTPVLADRASHMTLTSNDLGGEFRILVWSPSGGKIAASSGNLVSLPVAANTKLTVDRVELVDPMGRNLQVNILAGPGRDPRNLHVSKTDLLSLVKYFDPPDVMPSVKRTPRSAYPQGPGGPAYLNLLGVFYAPNNYTMWTNMQDAIMSDGTGKKDGTGDLIQLNMRYLGELGSGALALIYSQDGGATWTVNYAWNDELMGMLGDQLAGGWFGRYPGVIRDDYSGKKTPIGLDAELSVFPQVAFGLPGVGSETTPYTGFPMGGEFGPDLGIHKVWGAIGDDGTISVVAASTDNDMYYAIYDNSLQTYEVPWTLVPTVEPGTWGFSSSYDYFAGTYMILGQGGPDYELAFQSSPDGVTWDADATILPTDIGSYMFWVDGAISCEGLPVFIGDVGGASSQFGEPTEVWYVDPLNGIEVRVDDSENENHYAELAVNKDNCFLQATWAEATHYDFDFSPEVMGWMHDIMWSFSEDGGYTWSPPVNLTQTPGINENSPHLALSGGVLAYYIDYYGGTYDNYSDILFFSGLSFPDVYVAEKAFNAAPPVIAFGPKEKGIGGPGATVHVPFSVTLQNGVIVTDRHGALATHLVDAFGSYEALIQYDPSCMTLVDVVETFPTASEHFDFAFIPGGSGKWPGVRVYAVRDKPNNTYTPPIEGDGWHPLFDLVFHMAADWDAAQYNCFVNVVTKECGDNSFSDPSGLLMMVPEPGYWVDGAEFCDAGKFADGQYVVTTFGGEVSGPINDPMRGDVNLDDIAYSAADAVFFANVLLGLWGPDDLPPGWDALSWQIASGNSDVNMDEFQWTVADFALLLAIANGLAEPGFVAPPTTETVRVTVPEVASGTATISADFASNVAAGYFILRYEGEVGTPTLAAGVEGMTLSSNDLGGELRLLVWAPGGMGIEALSGALVNIPVSAGTRLTVEKVAFADPKGRDLRVDLETLSVDKFALSANLPNPLRERTVISFALPKAVNVSLKVYDAAGQLVRTLIDAPLTAGVHEVAWNATDKAGRGVANGIYFYRLEAGSYSAMKKMVVLR